MINIYELTVAAVLEREGHRVCCEDFVSGKRSLKQFTQFLENDTSEVYLFWSVNLSIGVDTAASQQILRLRPEAFILYMGPAPTFHARNFLQQERQIVVRGEPEMTVRECCRLIGERKPWQEIRGISFLNGEGKVQNNPARLLMKNLDLLPFPARHLVDRRRFSNPKLKRSPYTAMVTSRNCPFQCIYCVPSSLTFARELEHRAEAGRKPFVSMRSPENVIEEIDLLAAQGYRAIGFMDDNFITTEKRLQPIADALQRHGIAWGCQARADAITEGTARILGESGCGYVDLGVESFNNEILTYIGKHLTRGQILRAIELLNRHRVPVKLNILIGTSPLETKETIRETLRTAIRLKVDQVMINIVSPFPGTAFYGLAKANGWIEGGEYVPTDVQHHSILSYPNLSSREMENLLFRYNIRFFLRPRFIWSQMRRFSSFSEFWRACKALKNKLGRIKQQARA
jgi:radical SAM superfamily enzyme YgiQ (UPF0313 family)